MCEHVGHDAILPSLAIELRIRPAVPGGLEKLQQRGIVYGKQRTVRVLFGIHDLGVSLGKRSEDRVSASNHLGAGRAHANENLPTGIVQPAAVAPNHRHRKPHRTTLRQVPHQTASELACRLAGSLCARCNFAGHPDWVMGRRPANASVPAWLVGPSSH